MRLTSKELALRVYQTPYSEVQNDIFINHKKREDMLQIVLQINPYIHKKIVIKIEEISRTNIPQ